jgi:hypothetical protein
MLNPKMLKHKLKQLMPSGVNEVSDCCPGLSDSLSDCYLVRYLIAI